MATLGTEDSGRCREWQLWRGLNKIQCMDCLQKSGHCIEVAVMETWPLVDKFNCVTYT